jgi:ribosome-associated heat shock protein Hsp15
MSEDRTEEGPGAARIDRWLYGVRLFKSRSMATQAVTGGKVHVNGDRVKPSREVRAGDLVTFVRASVEFECTVAGIPLRRGPATEAAQCYVESPASVTRRAEFAQRMKNVSGMRPRPDQRPDKHGRQALRRLRGRID